jgi:hypothetical protein
VALLGRALDSVRDVAHAPAMGIRREAYEEMAARHLREWKDDERVRRRFWIRTTLVGWLLAAPGFALGAWAFHVTDPELGWILLRAGMVTVIVAVLATVGRAIHVAQQRGWL